MKKLYTFFIPIGIWVIAALACSLVQPQPAAPSGQYYCDVWEYGLLTTYPVFTISAGGKMTDTIAGKDGTWKYDARKELFTFTGEVSLQKAAYDPPNSEWLVTVKPEYQADYLLLDFLGAEEGLLHCYLAYPDQQP